MVKPSNDNGIGENVHEFHRWDDINQELVEWAVFELHQYDDGFKVSIDGEFTIEELDAIVRIARNKIEELSD